MRIVRKNLLIAPALALLCALLLGVPGAGAQERESVDLELSMTNRYGGGLLDGTFEVSVKNNSPVTVRNIRVQLEVDDLTEGRTIYLVESKPRSTSFYRNDGFVDVDTLEWVIPEIRGGLSATTRLNTDQVRNAQTTPDQPLLLRLRGGIVESSPPEAPGRRGNNQARTYFRYTYTNSIIARTIMITSLMYGVDADPDADTFTVKVRNRNRTLAAWTHVTPFQYQLRVRATPSPGLHLAATPPSGTSFNPSTGIWDIGTLPTSAAQELEIRVTGRDARAGLADDQCLTVEIAHIIPDLEEPHLPYTACMDHKALITAGPFDIFKWHDCVPATATAYPCDSDPDTSSLELVAVKWGYRAPYVDPQRVAMYDIGDVHRARFRSDVVGPGSSTNSMVLQPEEVVVQVADDFVNRVDRSGNIVWSTAELFDLYLEHQNLQDAGNWSKVTFSATVTAPGGGRAPGYLAIWDVDDALEFIGAPDDTKVGTIEYEITGNGGLIFQSPYVYPIKMEFGALGTYNVLFEIVATKTVSSVATEYTDNGTYTFHVGPVAELEVRDEPARSLAEPGQRAYTIVARNQGPDTAPAVQVTLTGVPEGAEVIASRGEYDPDTGIWTIGEMLDAESLRARGEDDAEVLTIITPSSGNAITATIENAQDYSVVIDGTTHTAKYYDYLDHNNEAEITLRSVPRAGPPGRPERPTVARLPGVPGLPAFALVRWAPMAYLNGFRVSHYEVQRSSSPWETEPIDVKGPVYLDMGLAPGQRAQYRVRAVNEAGGHGPWSLASAQGTGGLGAPNGLTATPGLHEAGRIDLSWFAPAAETGLSYRIEHATDGAGPWTTLRTQSGTTYSHTGLLSGTTHYYRVATVKGSLVSAWAYVQATTEIVGDGAVHVPLWPEYLRFNSVSRTAVTLAWDPPADYREQEAKGTPVTGYEYRVTGPCASGSGTCDIVTPRRVSGTSVRITGLNREGMYQFEVRALNIVGAGEWSQGIQHEVVSARAGGDWRVIMSPSRLTVREGGEATYRVRLSRDPKLPVVVFLHWMGDEDLGGNLPAQQGQILIPRGYDLSKLKEDCFGYNHQDPDRAYAWNVGVPITVQAAEDDDSENGKLTIRHDIATVSETCLKDPPANYDTLSQEMYDLALEATERDND